MEYNDFLEPTAEPKISLTEIVNDFSKFEEQISSLDEVDFSNILARENLVENILRNWDTTQKDNFIKFCNMATEKIASYIIMKLIDEPSDNEFQKVGNISMRINSFENIEANMEKYTY